MSKTLRLATRRSQLALAQARAFAAALQAAGEGVAIEEVHIFTSGDRFTDRPLQALGGKGLFIKEIEEALLAQAADFAVHSIKDVPAEVAGSLRIACIPEREDPRDVLVSATGAGLADLPRGAKVGTSSLRRKAYLLAARPDLDVGPLRGNVDTRLRKLDEGQVDAIVLALAGLRRLDLTERATEVLAPEISLPAVGQGALGIECRAGDADLIVLLRRLDHRPTAICVAAERAFMAAVGGSCQLPVAAYALRQDAELWLRVMVGEADGSSVRRAEGRAPWPEEDDDSFGEVVQLGHELGAQLR